ncbi:MAG: UrcA family protein [Parvularculaceae bacterium]
MSMLKSLIGAAVIVIASSSAASALEFRFDREALNYNSGVASTARSVERFAEKACGFHPGNYIGLRERLERTKCKAEVTEEVVVKIGDSRLSAAISERMQLASK